MAYDINEEKSYRQSGQTVFQAAVGAVSGLEGKVLKQDAGAGTLEARFDKKIHGKVLGDRTEMNVTVATPTEGESTVSLEAYPIDAIGRKLMFGARKGVTRQVVNWYWAHLEHRLPQ